MAKNHKVAARFCGHVKPRGFTLIELLLVIAIVAVLASLLLPTLSRVKARGHLARCKSHLRQVALAMRMYVDDHGAYPLYWYPGERELAWTLFLRPYLSAKHPLDQFGDNMGDWGLGLSVRNARNYLDVFRCPADPVSDKIYGFHFYRTLSGKRTFYNYWHSSYGYNVWLDNIDSDVNLGLLRSKFYLHNGQWIFQPAKEHEVKVPSDMIMLGDDTMNLDLRLHGNDDDGVWTAMIKELMNRHCGKVNIAFCDGHVDHFPYRRIFGFRDDFSPGEWIYWSRKWHRDHEPYPCDREPSPRQ